MNLILLLRNSKSVTFVIRKRGSSRDTTDEDIAVTVAVSSLLVFLDRISGRLFE